LPTHTHNKQTNKRNETNRGNVSAVERSNLANNLSNSTIIIPTMGSSVSHSEAASKSSSSPTSTSTSLFDRAAATADYGSGSNNINSSKDNTINSERSSISRASYASIEELENADLLFEEKQEKSKFNPNCIFESSDIWRNDDTGGFASIGDEISNLLKNIVGSGGLSLPAGIAAYGNTPNALLPALFVIIIMGLANAFSFSLLGRICAITKSHTYSMAWEKTISRVHSPKYQIFVDCVVFGKALLGTWSFSIIIASTCTPLVRYVISSFNGSDRSSTHYDVSSEVVLITITVLILFPLCLSQRLGSLSIFSAIGTLGTFVTISTMAIRYFDGTYTPEGSMNSIAGGSNGTISYYDDLSIEQRPSFYNDGGTNSTSEEEGAISFFTSLKSLTLISILSTGYVAHYNAPKYYYELKDHTTGRFNIVITVGFMLAAITYTIVSSLGFLTFGQNSLGFILDNYSYRDPLATIARFGVAISVIFAYPLLFHGGRDGLLALLKPKQSSTTSSTTTVSQLESNIVTVVLLSFVTVLAIYVNNLTFVLSFSGATMSTLIIYIFPPIMFVSLVTNCCCHMNKETEREVKLAYLMMIIGGILGIGGAYVSIASIL
jgi:amino acid permease